jgi:hypothetical protein
MVWAGRKESNLLSRGVCHKSAFELKALGVLSTVHYVPIG